MTTLTKLFLGACTALAIVTTAFAAAPSTCRDCATVQSVREVRQQGQGTGLGAVTGGVVGGVLGHQIGSGRGNTVATIAGAGVGAVAGHQVEKSAKSTQTWQVELRMDDGSFRTFTYTQSQGVREGDRVKLLDNGRRLALIAP
jgi:outer membrane lipoprotein SlyB